MKTLSRADIAFLKRRLAEELSDLGVTYPEAEAALQESQTFHKAKARLLQRKKAEAFVEAEAREREEEWQYQQILLRRLYDGAILPSLRAWYRVNPTLDPLRYDADAWSLYDELIERGVAVEPLREGRFTTFALTTPYRQGKMRHGRGTSDVFREALVLAWWDTYKPEEER